MSLQLELLPLARAEAGPQGFPGGGMGALLLQLGAIFLIFYFLIIRPARTKQKKTQQMLETLHPGQSVVTSGGIRGTVIAVSEDIIQLRIADNVKVDFSKNAIVSVLDKRE